MRYPRFIWKALGVATEGGIPFYTWMFALTAVMLVGINAWAHQLSAGMGTTALSDHVSWGFYIGNFTYGVGLAAGALMMLVPAFIYKDRSMNDVVLVGLVLAIAVICGALAFVTVDIGRPEKSWHLMPALGVLNWPGSMLSWDVLVLGGYLLLNLHVTGYLLYMRYLDRHPSKIWYLPFVFLSILWAVTLEVEAAFLFAGLGGRPFWNTAILAPRFLVTAFVSGPAFLIIALQIIKRFTGYPVSKPVATLYGILKVTVLLNLVMVLSEVFTELYPGGAHSVAATYLYFGLHGHNALVPFIWSAMIMELIAIALLYFSHPDNDLRIGAACLLLLGGVWVEKGLGLVVPAFVPGTLHQVVEYLPNSMELKVSAGILALVLMIFTLGIKITAAVVSGQMKDSEEAA